MESVLTRGRTVDEESRLTNNLLIRLACLTWFCLAQFVTVVDAVAQSLDVEPPIIEHEVVESEIAAERQSFLATVADDDELASVRFLYRFEGETSYTSIDMDRVSYSSTFTVQIPTGLEDSRSIEYYIEARDVSGNRTLRGYNFSPLIRFIEVPQVEVEPSIAEAATKTVERKPLYFVAGALVLGALVGALANSGRSSGPGSNPGPSNCEDGLCDFTVTINQPGRQ